ncbi:MAG: hypothetical protein RLZZ427_181 [Pseudomonadota bacterium]|jgi:hypothetical protein
MFRKSPSMLDRAIAASVAAMLAMNVFVLAQQVTQGQQVAQAAAATTARQA